MRYLFSQISNYRVTNGMEKIEWYSYLKLPKEKKQDFIGTIVGEDNIVRAFLKGEERKYKAALKKQQGKDLI